jgi:Ca-activated chloride channel homolog
MFARLRSPRLTELRLVWPEGEAPRWVSPLPRALFDGDTVHCFAGFGRVPSGMVRLLGAGPDAAQAVEVASAVLAPGGGSEGELSPVTGDALARMAALARLQSLSASDTVELAVAYQLVTDRTSYLLVHARAEGETPTEMPDLHKVAQMVPAGWGGMGSVESSSVRFSLAAPCLDESAASAPPPPLDISIRESRSGAYRKATAGAPNADVEAGQDLLDIPVFLRRTGDSSRRWPRGPRPSADEHPGRTPLALSNWLRKTPRNRWPRTYQELQALGVGAEVLDWLELVIAVSDFGRWAEETVVATFLHCVASDEFHKRLAQPGGIADTVRGIVGHLQGAMVGQPRLGIDHQVDPHLVARIVTALRGTTADRWPDSVCGLTA